MIARKPIFFYSTTSIKITFLLRTIEKFIAYLRFFEKCFAHDEVRENPKVSLNFAALFHFAIEFPYRCFGLNL